MQGRGLRGYPDEPLHSVTAIADKLGVEFALIHRERKRRAVAAATATEDREETMEVLVGNIEGKVAVLVDDMIDTGNTLTMAAHTLSRKGARAVYALISHGESCSP
jgi:ribose-phosphate pyrophosphokinase